MRLTWAFMLLVVAAAVLPARAHAADVTDVATAFDEDDPFDFRLRVRYDHSEKRAQIKREFEGLSPSQTSIAQLKDLLYAQSRDDLTLRAEIGLYHDLMLSVELPITIDESATYSYDNSAGSGCRYAPDANPNCVNAANSSTVADNIVGAGGYDARNGGAALGGNTLFRTVTRGAGGGK
ncbi:MAG TPA: hypothetical protein VHB97_02420, partial [Polyangia bacterium]|nr:hypothetical protein [Polyangia bacterium]